MMIVRMAREMMISMNINENGIDCGGFEDKIYDSIMGMSSH